MKRYWLLLLGLSLALIVELGVLAWAHSETVSYGKVVQQSDETYNKKVLAAKRTLDTRIAKEAAEKKAAEEAAAAKQRAEEAKKAEEAAKAAAAEAARKTSVVPLSYVPVLATANCSGGVTIAANAVADLTALCDVAHVAGVPLGVSSSYRSYNTQVSTYNYWVGKDGQVAADTYSARPGYSEHQTGLALDFRVPGGPSLDAFTGTAQQQWLAANAWHYGFIQRYTDTNSGETGYMGESWHYRYVGRATAADYAGRGISSLESYWGMPGGGY